MLRTGSQLYYPNNDSMTAQEKEQKFNEWRSKSEGWDKLPDYGLAAEEVIRWVRGYDFEDD